jgi:predicted acyltransferase
MTTPRALSLDALRGFAILGMVLSGSVTFTGELPAWMYHAQVPPPAYRFVPTIPGITWVDLVFPFFLFSMGAAIPLAFANKYMPESWRESLPVALALLKRGLLLAFFAIFTAHIKVFAYSGASPSWFPPVVGLAGYGLLFLMFTRFPISVVGSKQTANILQATGIALSVLLMISLTYPVHPTLGTSWNPFRSDIILLLLSNVAVVGSVIWLFTRTNASLRLGLLAFYLALRLAETQSNFIGSWQHWVWYATPAAWLFKVYYLQYLFIVLPGTIAGELIVRAFQGRSKDAGFDESPPPPLTRGVKAQDSLRVGDFGGMTALKAFLCFAFIPINLVGLFTRSLMLNLALNLTFIALCYALIFRKQVVNKLQQLHRRLFNNGVFWLLLGLAFEAFEGGIKKDKSTLSYYFLTSGLAFLFLITLSVVVDELKQQRWLQAIIDCGQNPMIAYVTGGMLLIPLLTLTGLQPWYETAFAGAWLGVWLGALRGVLFTALVVVITQFCTKRGVVWRT